MITIDYVCGFANRLFQYCVANIIADRHTLMVPPSPIDGISRSYQEIAGKKLEGEPELVTSPSDVYNILNRDTILRPLLIRGLFQQSALYLNNQSDIRGSWLKLDSSIQPSEAISTNDLVIHIRRGDYLLHNWGAPFSFYQDAIKSLTFDRILIVTDDPNDPFLNRFHAYRPSIICSHYLNDFALLTRANKIIMSPSTFSWWGAFLSRAEEIFFPIPCHGIWSSDYDQQIDLTLPTGFTEYKYLKCREPLSLNTMERIYFERKYLGLKLRNQGFAGYFKGHARSIIRFGNRLVQWNT